MSWGRGVLAVAALLVLAPPAAADPPVRGADYVGSFGGEGNISFSVSSDGRRLYAPQATGIPATCAGTGPETVGFRSGTQYLAQRISPGGGFNRTFDLDSRVTLRGGFGQDGLARGDLSYSDRADCRADVTFTARARERRHAFRGIVYGWAQELARSVAGAAQLPDRSIVVADDLAGVIRRIGTDGRARTIFGPGDGIDAPGDIAPTGAGGYLFTEPRRNCVRRVSPGGRLSTVAGRCERGPGGFAGDGGPATEALLSGPTKIATGRFGGFFVTDGGGTGELFAANRRVRQVHPDGTIVTVAGNGLEGSTGDGGPATAATFSRIADIAHQTDGDLLIADRDAARVRRVSSADGTISTDAGTGFGGFAGDGGPATAARLEPTALLTLGNVAYRVADASTGRIRQVYTNQRIDTIAGAGEVETGVPAGRAGRLFGDSLDDLGADSMILSKKLLAAPGDGGLLVGLPARNITYARAILRRSGLPVSVTRRSRAVVDVTRRGRVLARSVRRVRAGRSAIRLPRALRLRRRTPYRLRVTVSTGRAIARTTMQVLVP